MNIETHFGPAATIAVCTLEANEAIVAESGALLSIQGQVSIETSTRQKKSGGILQGIKRLIGGESFFINTFTARTPAQICLSTALPGDIIVKELNGEKLIIQSGSYVACTPDIEIKLEWQGLKSMFSGEGLFWINAQGTGKVIVSSFGFIYPIEVNGEYIVDTSHIVAFEETLNFRISKASRSLWQTLMGGEGFVCRFSGKGTVWCQSHSARSFGSELRPHLRAKKQ